MAENNYCQITLVSLQGITTAAPLMPTWRDFKTVDNRMGEGAPQLGVSGALTPLQAVDWFWELRHYLL